MEAIMKVTFRKDTSTGMENMSSKMALIIKEIGPKT